MAINVQALADCLSLIAGYLPPESEVLQYLEMAKNSSVDQISTAIELLYHHPLYTAALPYIHDAVKGGDKLELADCLIKFADLLYPDVIKQISEDEDLTEKFAVALESLVTNILDQDDVRQDDARNDKK